MVAQRQIWTRNLIHLPWQLCKVLRGSIIIPPHHVLIKYAVPHHTEVYTDLSQTYLYVKFRILKENGDDLADDSKVHPVTNPFTVCSVVSICTWITNWSPKFKYLSLQSLPWKRVLSRFWRERRSTESCRVLYESEPGVFDMSNAPITDRRVPWLNIKLLNLRVDYISISVCRENICQME